MNTHTPKAITEGITKFCQSVVLNSIPQFLRVTPDSGCVAQECFHNVRALVNQKGGRIQFGWAIWEWENVFLEAEHHAVYVSQAGEWTDVTPCLDKNSARLFLPDDGAVYSFDAPNRRDNIRYALVDDPIVDEFFTAAEKHNSFINNLPGTGMVTVHASEQAAFAKIRRRFTRANEAMVEKYGGSITR